MTKSWGFSLESGPRRVLRRTIIRLSALLYETSFGRSLLSPAFFPPVSEIRGVEVAERGGSLIRGLIDAGQPALVGRLGSIEARRLISLARRFPEILNSESPIPLLNPRDRSVWNVRRGKRFRAQMDDDPQAALQWAQTYFEALREIDLLGVWSFGESYFLEHLSHAGFMPIGDLQPWNHDPPWSEGLAGKKVVVVSPFAQTIRSQYSERREILFEDDRVLPAFDLRLVEAFLPGLRELNVGQGDFFAKLKILVDEVHKEPFDVAIVGSGPNGLMIAAEVKRRGSLAIQLGGATQLLFGIRGKRWEEQGFSLFNPHWVRPSMAETPQRHLAMFDNGAYW